MESVPDSCQLESTAQQHDIAIGVFLPLTILRLGESVGATQATLTVRLRRIQGTPETDRRLCISWSPASRLTQPLGVQETTVTELAALGLACAILPVYARLRVRAVASPGDRFDFWITDGKEQFGLEVSGTMTVDLETRHREKVRQLRQNPHGIDGYVFIAGFATRTAILSFNRFAEVSP